jgi:hypothetical protein
LNAELLKRLWLGLVDMISGHFVGCNTPFMWGD